MQGAPDDPPGLEPQARPPPRRQRGANSDPLVLGLRWEPSRRRKLNPPGVRPLGHGPRDGTQEAARTLP
eukprot:15442231-Alexandrium_andersonii.AAC.1